MTSLPLSRDYATLKFDLLVEIELSLSHTHKEKRRSEHISTCILCIFYTYARCPIDTEAQHPALRRPRELARSTGDGNRVGSAGPVHRWGRSAAPTRRRV